MPWYLRFLIAGTVVCLASWIAKRASPTLAGMILAFPFLIGTALVFTISDGEKGFRAMAGGVLWGIVPLAFFCVSTVLIVKVLPPWAALSIGALVWIAVAGVVYLVVVR
jgi:uncharacterized membrane protein (GlpM family)